MEFGFSCEYLVDAQALGENTKNEVKIKKIKQIVFLSLQLFNIIRIELLKI
jgi:hypothetical protein